MPPSLPPSLAGYSLNEFKGRAAVRRPPNTRSMGRRNLGTGRAAMPEPPPEPAVENAQTNTKSIYEMIISNKGNQSEGRAIVNFINANKQNFPQHRIDDLITYAKEVMKIDFGELTIPVENITNKKPFTSFGGRTRKMRKGTRKMRARKGKSQRSRR